jgi:hypothetical protein
MPAMTTRAVNESKLPHWEDLPGNGRRYWIDVQGRSGWRTRYIKIVDGEEKTLSFFQEIYNDQGDLVEVHEKFPEDCYEFLSSLGYRVEVQAA